MLLVQKRCTPRATIWCLAETLLLLPCLAETLLPHEWLIRLCWLVRTPGYSAFLNEQSLAQTEERGFVVAESERGALNDSAMAFDFQQDGLPGDSVVHPVPVDLNSGTSRPSRQPGDSHEGPTVPSDSVVHPAPVDLTSGVPMPSEQPGARHERPDLPSETIGDFMGLHITARIGLLT